MLFIWQWKRKNVFFSVFKPSRIFMNVYSTLADKHQVAKIGQVSVYTADLHALKRLIFYPTYFI